MFEPSYVMPDTIPAPCGSRVVPKLEHVQTLVRIFRDNYKDFKNGCVPDLKDLNGLTAILLLLWQLMAGARNVPTELPGYLLDGGGCIGVAKDNIISLYNWPEVLNEPLEQLFDVQYEVLRRHPDWKVPMTKWTPRLDFISLDRTKNQLDYSGTGPQEIRNALSAFPPTRHLSKVYKFALRHFSMNELYASNQFAAADIESFHHRHAVATSSLGRDSMEDPRMPVMRERMQRYLWRLIS